MVEGKWEGERGRGDGRDEEVGVKGGRNTYWKEYRGKGDGEGGGGGKGMEERRREGERQEGPNNIYMWTYNIIST